MTLDRTKLLSHRLRGFGARESSLTSLNSAILADVRHFEVDVRATNDREFVTLHDPGIFSVSGEYKLICEMSLDELRKECAGSEIATLDEICKTISKTSNKDIKLHVDIKVSGFEKEISDIIFNNGIEKQVVFVSWIPSVLLGLNKYDSAAVLCFSHLPLIHRPWLFACASALLRPTFFRTCGLLISRYNRDIANQISAIHLEFVRDGRVPFSAPTSDMTTRTIWGLALGKVADENMRDLLVETNGYICIPKVLASRHLIQSYQRMGIRVAVFSAKSEKQVVKIDQNLQPDLIYVDYRF